MLQASRVFACLAMIVAGAVAGTVVGNTSNAARPAVVVATAVASDNNPVLTPPPARAPARSNPQNNATAQTPVRVQTVRESARPAPLPSASSIVAARFPSHWQDAAVEPTVSAPQVLAYADEPRRPTRAAAATSGFALASVDPAPTTPAHVDAAPSMPKRIVRPAQPKNPVLFNDAQITSIKARLRLTSDQEAYWPQVAQALRAISWRIASQQQNGSRNVRGGQAALIDPSSPEVAQLKSAAFPLIMSMREDQKHEVRQLAHTMGLTQVAAMF